MRLSKKKRKEIKQAAKSIGSVIAQQMHLPETKSKKEKEEEHTQHPLQAHLLSDPEAVLLRKKKFLVGGTCVFALCILLSFWVLQIKTMVYDVSATQTEQPTPLSIVGVQEEFGAVITELEELETIVNQNAQAAINATSSSLPAGSSSSSRKADRQNNSQTKEEIKAVLGGIIVSGQPTPSSSQ